MLHREGIPFHSRASKHSSVPVNARAALDFNYDGNGCNSSGPGLVTSTKSLELRRYASYNCSVNRFAMKAQFLAVALFAAVLPGTADTVSYFNDVRPLLQVNCSGCHQPANKLGGLDITTFAGILKGGAKHGSAITAGTPENSAMVKLLSGALEPRMPMGGEALPQEAQELISNWIREGAEDDTPPEAKAPQVPSEPPNYAQSPTITGMAYSPDGSLLAVGGFHEILLHNSDGSSIEARLLGRSDKIHSINFSSDGKQLVAIGGTPARFGEVQLWDVGSRKQIRSVTATSDTLFAGDLSPDGKSAVYGAADKTVRMVNLETGEEVYKAGHHEDWVLQVVFGIDGKRIVSIGRDRAAKLAVAATGAFLENVNFLRDKLYAIARHPRRDYVLVGGEDRVPYLYTMDRPRALKIADDSTLIRKFDEQAGKIFALAFSPDGSLAAVGGVADEVPVYDTESGDRVATCRGHEGGIFVIDFHPDGTRLATGGFDGVVRVYDSRSGEQVHSFVPVPVERASASEDSKGAD